MAMAKKEQYFDLEFFMKSSDVGLYNVAKEIFSHLNPRDLEEMRKVNKTFYKFLKKEENFLWRWWQIVKAKTKNCDFVRLWSMIHVEFSKGESFLCDADI